MLHLSAPDLAAWLADPARPKPLLLDVREPWEVATAAMPGITPIPMNQIPAQVDAISSAAEAAGAVVAICHHGARSLQVALFLESRGIGPLHNLTGGINAWSTQVDPSVPRY
jgi:rhodanese-related sulfurtransferase